MSSTALSIWNNDRAQKLDYMEDVHRAVGGSGPGRRFTTDQINQLYIVAVSGEFQGFCRDLHDECSDHWVLSITSANHRIITRDLFLAGRKLSSGNPNPSNLGSDFGRFGLKLWAEVKHNYSHGQIWQDRLEVLSGWRNAVAHQDFSPKNLSGVPTLTLKIVRKWHRACNGLAKAFDMIMRNHLLTITGQAPW